METPKTKLRDLPPDMIRRIALNMKPYDFVRFCMSDEKFNRDICGSDMFWRQKLTVDFPLISNYYNRIGLNLKNPRRTYMRTLEKIGESIEDNINYILDEENILKNNMTIMEKIMGRTLATGYRDMDMRDGTEAEVREKLLRETHDVRVLLNTQPDKFRKDIYKIVLYAYLELSRRQLSNDREFILNYTNEIIDAYQLNPDISNELYNFMVKMMEDIPDIFQMYK